MALTERAAQYHKGQLCALKRGLCLTSSMGTQLTRSTMSEYPFCPPSCDCCGGLDATPFARLQKAARAAGVLLGSC